MRLSGSGELASVHNLNNFRCHFVVNRIANFIGNLLMKQLAYTIRGGVDGPEVNREHDYTLVDFAVLMEAIRIRRIVPH